MNTSKRMQSALFALLTLFAFGFSATLAQAQQAVYYAAAPRIDGFDVEQATRLTVGNELLFTLYGSPGGTATVRIDGVVDRFPLEEVETGVYEGTYTIKSRDRVKADAMVTANLRAGNRIATAVLDESILAGAASRSDAKRAADAALAATPKIDRFEVDPAYRLTTGENLFFSVNGTPGATASVRISGVKGKVSLQEIMSGMYEGSYTIKDRDRIAANAAVTATLRRGGRESSALLGQSLLASAGRMPSARAAVVRCANCGAVESINVIEVAGEGTYLGKIAGGVLGAVLGNQVGGGRGQDAMTVVGAVGGAVAGNEIEKRSKKTKHYDVTVRLQDGGSQTISYATEPAFRVGDKVRVENGALILNP